MTYPKAIGPYSAYRESGDLIFISGQLPLDPTTMEFASTDIKGQTHQSLSNIQAILKELGLQMDCVIKTTVLLADIADFAEMNEVYATFFSAPYPARSAFAVKDLPKGAKVEIEVIASKK
ncbi:RidA family protein [Helicobacter kayseriensis]|uniref:RidA family protein n=1 Tax=Helicobacter kayseriensis TaxID=2905877 RepID=UPI001E4D42C2|nr:RidA family protein [Helicobacter kayseriensis]MCE3047067.1 RidA family protein [Helicobacter kayseriensis]MCE3048273.1 RidA family protein [Helicobacter kayseriensis]